MTVETNETERRAGALRAFALGVLVPGLVFLCAAAMLRLWPFGGNVQTDPDLIHQYFPFAAELRRKLAGGELPFFSFSGGLGYNLWATIAYYAASPLNLLLALVPESGVCDFVMDMILFKCALCGGTLAWYLVRSEGSGCPAAVSFGTLFALSNYLLGYKFNVMWLDSIAVTPLVMYGIESIVRGKRGGIYLFSLFYALWCNFYIGYMPCLFSCLYFLLLLFLEREQGVYTRLRRAGRFALCSLAGSGMASVLLLPAWLALRATGSSLNRQRPTEWLYNRDLSFLLAHYVDRGSILTSYDRGQVHLYCGVIVLLLFALYLFNRGIGRRERLAFGGLILFFLLCFSAAPLNYVWHGFHLEAGLPNRFAFLYLVVLLKLCCRSMLRLDTVTARGFWMAVGAVLALTAGLCAHRMLRTQDNSLLISLGLLALYALLLALRRAGLGLERRVSFLLCALMITEAAGHALTDFREQGSSGEAYYAAYQWDFQALMRGTGEAGFSRSEVDSRSMLNFPAFVGANGIALYSSTVSDSFCRFMRSLHVSTGKNMVLYRGVPKPVLDILGVKYVSSSNVTTESWNGLKKTTSRGGKNLYRNDEALSLGYLAPESILEWRPGGAGMESLNDFAFLCAGVDELYGAGKRFTGKSGEACFFDIPEGGEICVELDRAPDKIEWTTPEYSRQYDRRGDLLSSTNLLLPASSAAAPGRAELLVTTGGATTYAGTVYTRSADGYRKLTETLSARQLRNVRALGTTLTGEISADRGGILLLTLLYDRGWRAELDGKKAELLEIGGALTSIAIGPGEHRLRMYYVPQGFDAGVLLTAAAAALAFLLLRREKKT